MQQESLGYLISTMHKKYYIPKLKFKVKSYMAQRKKLTFEWKKISNEKAITLLCVFVCNSICGWYNKGDSKLAKFDPKQGINRQGQFMNVKFTSMFKCILKCCDDFWPHYGGKDVCNWCSLWRSFNLIMPSM